MNSLLPPNSTVFEQRLADTAAQAVTAQNPDVIRGLKFDPPADFLDLLLWEYGLGELSPYISDKRQLLQQGLEWQRVRGTAAALKIALSWIGITATVREAPPSRELNSNLARSDYDVPRHFAEYDLILPTVPSEGEICRIFALAQLSQPVRARLWRLVSGYDREIFQLDSSALDDALLDDDSGWRPSKEDMPCLAIDEHIAAPKLSFGQHYGTTIAVPARHCTSSIAIYYILACAPHGAAFPILDDLPAPFEVQRVIVRDFSKIDPALYTGQLWAAQPWPAASWRTARTLISPAEVTNVLTVDPAALTIACEALVTMHIACFTPRPRATLPILDDLPDIWEIQGVLNTTLSREFAFAPPTGSEFIVATVIDQDPVHINLRCTAAMTLIVASKTERWPPEMPILDVSGFTFEALTVVQHIPNPSTEGEPKP